MDWLYLTRAKGSLLALSFLSKDVAKIEKFKNTCYVDLPKSLHWFHQGNAETWQMFEFWSDKDDQILDAAIDIADKMGVELELMDPSSAWMNRFLKA
jgi:hypothetical protein